MGRPVVLLDSTGFLPSSPQTLVKKLQSSKDSKKRAAAAAALAYDDRDLSDDGEQSDVIQRISDIMTIGL